jgi:CheY-like chemotaxis protein
MRSATILIAEDERTARNSLAGLLEAEGFRVLAAEDGTQALSLLLSEEPEAALLDIRMPGMDGLTVLRRARGRFGYRADRDDGAWRQQHGD